jgi:hypothetical protein
MTKRKFLVIIFVQLIFHCNGQIKLYVALTGSDKNAGTLSMPFKSPEMAIAKALMQTGKDVIIQFREGVYNLNKTIKITSESYHLNSLFIRSYKNEKVTISGAKKITVQWQAYKNGILKSQLALTEKPDRLLMNGVNLPMARYPNYDSTARVFNGTAADAISDKKVASWSNPDGGYIHALHNGEWGDFHYLIRVKPTMGN